MGRATDPFVLGALVAGAAVALLLWRGALAAARQTTIEAMAERRRWVIWPDPAPHPALRLGPQDEGDWSLTLRPLRNPPWPWPGQRGNTQFTSGAARRGEGFLLIGPPRQERQALDHQLGPELAQLAEGLSPLPGAPGARLILMQGGMAAPEEELDLPGIHALLDRWQPRRPGQAGQPVLILGPEGIRLHLRHRLRDADEIEAFADLGLALTARLRR